MDILDTRKFWLRYLAAGTSFSNLPALRDEVASDATEEAVTIRIDYCDRFRMELEVDFEHRLSLIDSTREGKIDLGWMDCHQMSDAFRFEELRSVCLASRLRPLWKIEALLAHYAAPVRDTIGELVKLLFDALCESQLFTEHEARGIADYMKRIVRKEFRWELDPQLGWTGAIIAPESTPYAFPYTMRTAQNSEFDFESLNAFLAYCEQEAQRK